MRSSFSILKLSGSPEKWNCAEELLGGVFVSATQLHCFSLFEILLMKNAIEEGISRFHTYVSSNNLPVLKLHESFGYRVRSLTGVYVKHI